MLSPDPPSFSYPSPPTPTLSTSKPAQLRRRAYRRVHHKVKTGCKACKGRHQKCDEQKPTCSGCSRYSTECIYPEYVQSGTTGLSPESATSDPRDTRVVQRRRESPSASLSAPPSPAVNLADLELLHHYLMFTSFARGQHPQMTAYAQTVVPQVAQDHPFVMHGILAMAAMHLSRLRPAQHSHYYTLATRNHNAAMPSFRSTLEGLSRENCHGLIFYSKSLVWCAFADGETQHKETVSEQQLQASNKSSWLPTWFQLLLGSCHVVEAARPWLDQGPHVRHELDDTIDYAACPDDSAISNLMTELVPMIPDHTAAMECATVLSNLREAFVRASMRHENTPLRNAMNFWVGNLPAEYLARLRNKEPWALVVLAHFCLLVQRSETVWFMEGHGLRLMLDIVDSLDGEWSRFLEWPCQALGLDVSGQSSLDNALSVTSPCSNLELGMVI